jgi:hypothetical protein
VNGKTYASVDDARAHIISAPSSKTSIIEPDCTPRSATNPRSSSKPNSANAKPSETTQPKLCPSNPASQTKGAVHAYFPHCCRVQKNANMHVSPFTTLSATTESVTRIAAE